MALKDHECLPCRGEEPPLSSDEIEALMDEVEEWELVDGNVPKLRRVFEFDDFAKALRFTDRVGRIAEQQDHHPILVTEWGEVTVTWWTHKIDGLHKNDFIMAAKCDHLYAHQPDIIGIHGMFMTEKAEGAREFLRDTIGLEGSDVGEGWWIFDLPMGELGCHPAESPSHDVSFICEDIHATVERLREQGVTFTQEIEDFGFGIGTFLKLPGDVTVELYEPQYEK